MITDYLAGLVVIAEITGQVLMPGKTIFKNANYVKIK